MSARLLDTLYLCGEMVVPRCRAGSRDLMEQLAPSHHPLKRHEAFSWAPVRERPRNAADPQHVEELNTMSFRHSC